MQKQSLLDSEELIKINPMLSRKIVSFQGNKKVPFYNWFHFKEGFSSEMVQMFIKDYGKKTGTVLDPFSGSGTTLFTANELGYDALGIEILPIGEFIFTSRKSAQNLDINKMKKAVSIIKEIDWSKRSSDKKTDFRHLTITRHAFPEITEKKLNAFISYIDKEIDDPNIKQVLEFACFTILEKISFTRKDGQYLRWDSRAKKGRASFNKGKVYNFEEALFEKLDQIVLDISQKTFSKNRNLMELLGGSCLEILPKLENGSADLIITSPPYCNRYDYTRTYALELAFLGIDEDGLKRIRQNMLSCTVENKDKIELLKKLYRDNNRIDSFDKAEEIFRSNKMLQDILSKLEALKTQGKLNNPGIYRMVKNYFYEHAFVIVELSRILKENGRIYYVNDNVRYAGINIPVDIILSDFAKKSGLKIINIFTLQNGKGNSSQQMGMHGREELRKCVYQWEK